MMIAAFFWVLLHPLHRINQRLILIFVFLKSVK